jgi:DNA-binding transcriptional LysR family regulator
MELMQLEMFVAVVEERSMGKAANRVHRSQPAVTLAIGKLEDDIGGPVLDRSRVRDYRPTPAGEILYEYASRILGLRSEVSAILRDGTRPAGELCIGASGPGSIERTTELTRVFADQHPEVRVRVVSDLADHVLRELADRKLDLAFLASLPAGAQSNGDLVASPFTAGPAGARFWTVERRVGRSHVAKLFGEMLRTLPSGAPLGHTRARASRILPGRGRSGAKRSALGPAK